VKHDRASDVSVAEALSISIDRLGERPRSRHKTDDLVHQPFPTVRSPVRDYSLPAPEDYWQFLSKMSVQGSEDDRRELLRKVMALR
jgi:hypothetical protein